MFASSGMKKYISLWVFVALCTVSNIHSQLTESPSVLCSSLQLLCGGSICYDPATQYCTDLGTIVQCISACGDQCYNPSTQQCFNGTVCLLSEQLCIYNYNSWDGKEYNPPVYQCYDPTSLACFNNTLCDYPSRGCNQQCLRYFEVCANNLTVCHVKEYYYTYQPNQIQLCNGVCYDSATQQCVNDNVQCINNCSDLCYNSLTQQCFNGTVCLLSEQLCIYNYNSWDGKEYNPPVYQCYDPTSLACFNNTLCDYPSRGCNQQCLRYFEVCANNLTVCPVKEYYYTYQPNQIQLCNGVCYDSATQQCVNDNVQCINNCSDLCYNSLTQQCFNGTVCLLSEQLCIYNYNSWDGKEYNPPVYQCYDPTSLACFNNTLCDYPSRGCNQQCLRYFEVCANNLTVCHVKEYYYTYQPNQIQLCNGVCYDSATQQCVGGYAVNCILDPSTQECINQSTYYSQSPSTTSSSTLTVSTTTSIPTATFSTTASMSTSIVSTTISPGSPNCCSVKQCTEDADCCVRGIECQCLQHNNEHYGSCLNPYVRPICAEGCPDQVQCRNDIDCCKCQCGQVTVSNTNGSLVTKKQCVPR